MRNAADFPKIRDDRPVSIMKLATAVMNLVATIEAVERPEYLGNTILAEQLIQKLPIAMKHRWGKKVAEEKIPMTLTNVAEFFDTESAIVCAYHNPLLDGRQNKDSKTVLTFSENKEKKDSKCGYCENSHAIATCEQFKGLDVNLRWEWATGKRVCFKCLCKRCKRKKCGKNNCARNHHPLLHYERRESPPTAETPVENSSSGKAGASLVEKINVVRKKQRRVLMKIVPVALEGPNGQVRTHAFLDSGSSVTIIKDDLARRLGFQGRTDPLHSKWMNQITFEDSTSRRVSVKIIGSSETFQLEDIRTLKDLDLPCQPVEMDITECVDLKNMDLPDIAGVTPEIMIGEDYTHVKIPLKVVIGKTHEPVATLTRLGWAVHGPFMVARVLIT